MKLYILFFITLILIPGVFAVPPVTTIDNPDSLTISTNIPTYIPRNISREWEVHVFNETNILTSGVSCSLHIYDEYGDGGHGYKNDSGALDGYDFEFVVPASVHQIKGEYSFKAYCNTSNKVGLYELSYIVTEKGFPPASDFFKTFIYLLFILSLSVGIYTGLMSILNLALFNQTIYNVIFSWGTYLSLIIVDYLGRNYLISTFIEDITGNLIVPLSFILVILPVVSLIVTFFVKSTKSKGLIQPEEMTGSFRRW